MWLWIMKEQVNLRIFPCSLRFSKWSLEICHKSLFYKQKITRTFRFVSILLQKEFWQFKICKSKSNFNTRQRNYHQKLNYNIKVRNVSNYSDNYWKLPIIFTITKDQLNLWMLNHLWQLNLKLWVGAEVSLKFVLQWQNN